MVREQSGVGDMISEQYVELSVSDYAQIGSLWEWLRLSPDVRVERIAGYPGPGEQGALDVLTVVAGSSGLVAAVKTIPDFIRSRRSGLSVTITVKDEKLILNATNVNDITPILERLLDD